MHVIFRTLLHSAQGPTPRTRFHSGSPSDITLRALPTDVDILLHINNGQYFSLFDLGRYDLMARSGFWSATRKAGWHPVVQAEQITFRKSVNFWTKFQIHTKLIGVDDRCFYIEHRVVVDGEITSRPCGRPVYRPQRAGDRRRNIGAGRRHRTARSGRFSGERRAAALAGRGGPALDAEGCAERRVLKPQASTGEW